jgi:hypothetical protein
LSSYAVSVFENRICQHFISESQKILKNYAAQLVSSFSVEDNFAENGQKGLKLLNFKNLKMHLFISFYSTLLFATLEKYLQNVVSYVTNIVVAVAVVVLLLL